MPMTLPLLALLLAAPGIDAPGAPIEGAEHLAHLFAGLRARERGEPFRVRVTHLGDSHIAADLWTARLRDNFQARFGDAGRGFILAGRPWPSFWQAGVAADVEGEWRVDGLRDGLDDGQCGVGGCSVAANRPGSTVRLTAAVGRPFGAVDVHYVRQPNGGCIEVLVDGESKGVIDARGPWAEPGFVRFDLPAPGREVVARALGTGEARLLGFSLEGGAGVTWDALGINGAQVRRLMRHDPGSFGLVLRRLAPTLVVLSYGANELFDDSLTPERLEADLGTMLRRIREAAPEADCLVTGPFDLRRKGRVAPAMRTLQEVQRSVASAHRCAFWDAQAAMGGSGAILAWRKKGLAQKDFVHLTRPGYDAVGELLTEALLEALARASR